MSNLYISNLRTESSELGRIFKSSKACFVWEFVLDGVQRRIEIVHSRITGKRRITMNGDLVVKVQKFTFEFTYSFLIDKHYVNLVQTAPDTYDLRIDNLSFNSLMNQQKSDKYSRYKKDDHMLNSEPIKEPSNVPESTNNKFDVNNSNNLKKNVNNIDNDFFSGNSGNTQKEKKDNNNFFNDNDFEFSEDKTGVKGNKKIEKDTWNFDFDNKNNKANNFESFPIQTKATNTNTHKNSKAINFDDLSNNFSSNNAQNNIKNDIVGDLLGISEIQKPAKINQAEALGGIDFNLNERPIHNTNNNEVNNFNNFPQLESGDNFDNETNKFSFIQLDGPTNNSNTINKTDFNFSNNQTSTFNFDNFDNNNVNQHAFNTNSIPNHVNNNFNNMNTFISNPNMINHTLSSNQNALPTSYASFDLNYVNNKITPDSEKTTKSEQPVDGKDFNFNFKI